MSGNDEAHVHVQRRLEELQSRLGHATADEIENIRVEARYLTNMAFLLLANRSVSPPAPAIEDMPQPTRP